MQERPYLFGPCIKLYERNISSDFSKKPLGESGCSVTLENMVSAQYPTYFACSYCSNEKKKECHEPAGHIFCPSVPYLFIFLTFDLLFNVYVSHVWYSEENYKKPSMTPSLPATLKFPQSNMAAKTSTSFVTKQIGGLFMCL